MDDIEFAEPTETGKALNDAIQRMVVATLESEECCVSEVTAILGSSFGAVLGLNEDDEVIVEHMGHFMEVGISDKVKNALGFNETKN